MQDYEIYMEEPMLEDRAVPGGSSPTSLDSLLVEVRAVRRLLFYLLLIGAGTVLYFGQDVFLPVVLGILISLALLPPVAYLKKLYVPYPVGAILIVASIGALLYTGAINLSDPLTELFEDIPRIGERLEHHFQPFKETVEQITRAGDEIEKVTAGGEPGTTTEVTLGGPGVITSAASSFASSLTSVLIALILALFILGSGNLFFEKIVSSVPTLRDKKRAVHIVREVEGQVSRYLFTITIINFSLGVVIGIALALYGAPNPVLWGVVAALLNFLPFLGALIGAVLLSIVSFGYYDALSAAIIPPLIYYGASIIEGNLVTPYVVGRRMRLNIVAVFISVVFWGWLWGLIGALMAVPILLVVSVLTENIERWHLVHLFLSDKEEVVAVDVKMD